MNSKNIKSMQSAKKLDYKYYKPYIIDETIRKQAYRLKFLPSIKIHNFFYVLLLELYISTNEPKNSPLPPIEIKSKEKYKVKEILDSCIHYNKL